MNISREKMRQIMLMTVDAILIVASFVVALQLASREIADIHYRWYEYFWMLTVLSAVKLFIFKRTGLYRDIIRFVSMDFAVKIIKSTAFGSLVAISIIHVVRREIGMPVLIVDWMASCILIGISRFGMRYVMEGRLNRMPGRRTLLYGAGEHGAAVARHLMRNDQMGYRVIGFLDDDDTKCEKKIHGVPVFGGADRLADILNEGAVEEIIVAFARADGELLKRLVRQCREYDVRCRIVPSMADVIDGGDIVKNIDIADLMRRPKRNLDKQMVADFLKGKRVLITGAAGSIGSEIFKQVLSYGPAAVAALDHSEFGLYQLDEAFAGHSSKDRCFFSLVDIKCEELVNAAFESFKPDVVFHAAAYKHVPILEQDVSQGVLNNVNGVLNVVKAAKNSGVKEFVLISSDKAVRPTNVMGATKRIGELIVQDAGGETGMKCMSVRFGNVLASSGSVVPKFMKQIKAGGPVTVTHPEVTRYFMLIPEAVELVLQAASYGSGGEVFVLDMGRPVKITEMAEDLISLMGYVPHRDIKITYTGMRPGEKMYEELFLDEIESRTSFDDISVVKVRQIDRNDLYRNLDTLLSTARLGRTGEIRSIIKALVPEYTANIGCNVSSIGRAG
jgi:FlaA1/EpsC-like NDP-sugar epimerase